MLLGCCLLLVVCCCFAGCVGWLLIVGCWLLVVRVLRVVLCVIALCRCALLVGRSLFGVVVRVLFINCGRLLSLVAVRCCWLFVDCRLLCVVVWCLRRVACCVLIVVCSCLLFVLRVG